jgi:hypothetical protein
VAVRSKAWVIGRSLTRIEGSNPTRGMDVCVVLYGNMGHKWHEGRKDLIQYKNGSKGKNPGQTKKNPTGGMDVCVVFVVKTVIWNVKWHEGRKDLNSTKMDQREKTLDRQKKNPANNMDVRLLCLLYLV